MLRTWVISSICIVPMNKNKLFRPCNFVTDENLHGWNVLFLFIVATYVNTQY